MAELSGELVFSRAVAALEAAQAASGEGPLELDLSRVARVDSAGLALLLELKRQARRAGRELRFMNAPEQLRKLAEFFGLSPLLALS